MKARVWDRVEFVVDISGVSEVFPKGTRGVVIEAYEQPTEGYAVDVAIPDDTVPATGHRYDNVILYPDQFRVVT
jgi:hypothetical protein